MARSENKKASFSFERSEDVSLPVNQPPSKLLMGRDWEMLKKYIVRLSDNKLSWQRAFDISLAVAISFGIATASPGDSKIHGVPVRQVFAAITLVSLGFLVAAIASQKSEKQRRDSDKRDLEEWISDVEKLYQETASNVEDGKPETIGLPQIQDDEVYENALKIAYEEGTISTSKLQRHLRIGYGRAARLVERMEREGIVGEPDGSRPRKVLSRGTVRS